MSLNPSAAVPRWLVIAGSVVIAFHLGTIALRALAAPSGPWPNPEGGMYMGTPPQLAYSLNGVAAPYLKAIRMNDDYRFATDHPMQPGVRLEIRLKDENGQELARVQLPDENANRWVRHRQQLLAGGLSGDVPLMLPQSELVMREGQEAPKVDYWVINENALTYRLERKSVNQFLRDERHPRPSDLAELLARSYVRYLCRVHGADRAEILRFHQDPIPAAVLFENVPSTAFPQWTSYFGEFTREGKPIR